MKGNRGVTLTSLIVYIIGMLIMLATLATLRTFFSKNVDIRAINDDTIQYSKFASAFSTETNTKDNTRPQDSAREAKTTPIQTIPQDHKIRSAKRAESCGPALFFVLVLYFVRFAICTFWYWFCISPSLQSSRPVRDKGDHNRTAQTLTVARCACFLP